MNKIELHIRNLIAENNYLTLDYFLSAVIPFYYTYQESLGQAGDFVTAPELSQLYGEMIGIYMAHHWLQHHNNDLIIVELGPGNGYLMADFLRATKHMRSFHQSIKKIFLYEASPKLRTQQSHQLQNYAHMCEWFDNLDAIKKSCADYYCFFIANEFFDALPMKQYQYLNEGLYERCLVLNKEHQIMLTPHLPITNAKEKYKEGWIIEHSPVADTYVDWIANTIQANGGLSIIVDYGYTTATGMSTLQAIYQHQKINIFENIGNSDITYLVDFSTLMRKFDAYKIKTLLVNQKEFLEQAGIMQRAAMLASKPGFNRDKLRHVLHTLLSPDKMGVLFKVLLATN